MAYIRVQPGSNANFSSFTTWNTAAVFSGGTTAGNFVWGIVNASIVDVGARIASITDNAGNSYSVSANQADSENSTRVIFWCGNVIGGATTFSVVSNGVGGGHLQNWALVADEFSGVSAISDPKDGSPANALQGAPGTGANAVNSTSITTTFAGDLILGAAANATIADNTPPSSGTSPNIFTAGASITGPPWGVALEYFTQPSPGPIAATFTSSSGTITGSFVLAVKAPASATTLSADAASLSAMTRNVTMLAY